MNSEENSYAFIEFNQPKISSAEMIVRSAEFYQQMNLRRTVRDFSDQDVPLEVIQNIIKTAATAPSGANKQPWFFVAVSNRQLKTKIREAAEKEEYHNYTSRMTKEWLNDLKPLGTDWVKPYLETAPWLIVVFRKIYREEEGKKLNNYYVHESVGIATGFLLTAIHQAGLVALTHTPSPMNFLSTILKRPSNEKPFLLIPVGYPADNAMVPDITRKNTDEIAVFI